MTQDSDAIHPFARYLLAKRPVDDAALHPRLWQSFLAYLDRRDQEHSESEPLHVLELGCGIGTMAERILQTNRLHNALYTAIDSEPQNLHVAAQRLDAWAGSHGYQKLPAPPPLSAGSVSTLSYTLPLAATAAEVAANATQTAPPSLMLQFICADAQDDMTSLLAVLPPIHALIAHAFLDLVECRPLLAQLSPAMASDARLYLTINFDGMTIFEPVIDPQLDEQIIALYHATMDNRQIKGRPAGHSQTGRRLFHDLRSTGYEVLDMGSSDWIVFPRSDGYTNHDAQFLHHILDFVEGALKAHPALDPDRFARWIVTRRQQIEAAELVYLAHQLDYLARPSPTTPV